MASGRGPASLRTRSRACPRGPPPPPAFAPCNTRLTPTAPSPRRRLHSFCIGLEGSPDLKAGKAVADFLGTDHHEFTFTVQEGIDAIGDVINHVETYDVTTIRWGGWRVTGGRGGG
jgi:hypothetical protein